MKKVLLAIAFLFLATPVLAQEASSEPEPVDPAEEVVAEADVPAPDSFGDFMQRFNERMQLLMTRDQNRKAQLELKFANRREAQLSKCGRLKDETKQEKCTQKVSGRSEKLLQRLENRTEKTLEKRKALEEKVRRARERKREKLEKVKERKRKDEDEDEDDDEGEVEGASVARPNLIDWVEEKLDDVYR